ncbi:cellulose biosynthesis cyclic di-GMP-binding regulatory protein BcsB [Camelimonas abortus]|uniref:Cyclic di-GMP-binding protein n=1 Tax=Camelimonas abortus TaxID=1017184 RepID=A0ABV7LDC8_9HYPH
MSKNALRRLTALPGRLAAAAGATAAGVALAALALASAASAQGLLGAPPATEQARPSASDALLETRPPAPAAPAAQDSGRPAAPPPLLQGSRPVFGVPPSGVPGQRIRSFLPRGEAQESPERAPRVPTTDAAPGGPGVPAGAYLRRMPVNLHGYRLRGEIDATEWPVYLTDAEARSRLQFRVSYLTAISVMPEASALTLIVNDVAVGQTILQAPSGARQAVFDIPADLVRPGWNSVRITADMRHRVDCSLGATYELWTQLDPANTGLLVYGTPPRAMDVADVASLSPDSFGAFPVRVILPGRTTLEGMNRVMAAVQAVALRARYLQPVVDVGPAADGDAGMNLLVGVYRDIAAQPGLEMLGAVNGPRVVLLPGANGRRPTLVITGQTADDLREALELAGRNDPPRGAPPGLAALANYRGLRVEGSERIPLSRLNIPSIEFNGRLFRVSFDLVLPPDFYTSDYAKVLLRLDGGYVAGLGPEPQISISVNGQDAATTVLSRRDGEVFRRNEIPFPLGRLQPGFNRVEILARVPSPADRACDPVAMIGAPKRFLLLDTSEIVIPTLARMAEMPNLAVTTSSAFPLTLTDGGRLFLPSPDRHSVGAAATIAAQMALAADRQLKLEVMVSPPADNDLSAVVVAPVGALSDQTLQAVNLSPAALKGAWESRKTPAPPPAAPAAYSQLARQRAALTRNLPGYCTMTPLSARPQEPATADAQTADHAARAGVSVDATQLPERDLLAQWNENIYGRTSLFAQVRDLVEAIAAVGARMASEAVSLAGLGDRHAPHAAPAATSLVMAQRVLSARPGSALVVVTGPNGEDLASAVHCLVSPQVWAQAQGQQTFLDAANGDVTTVEPTQITFMPTTVFSLVNARLVAASWLSHNPAIYVTASVLVAAFLGGATAWLLRNVGRKQ